MSIKDRIVEMVKDELMIDDFDINADLSKEYELDSISLLDFVMQIEEEYDIEIADGELSDIKSVQDIVDIVEKKSGN